MSEENEYEHLDKIYYVIDAIKANLVTDKILLVLQFLDEFDQMTRNEKRDIVNYLIGEVVRCNDQ